MCVDNRISGATKRGIERRTLSLLSVSIISLFHVSSLRVILTLVTKEQSLVEKICSRYTIWMTQMTTHLRIVSIEIKDSIPDLQNLLRFVHAAPKGDPSSW